MPLRFRRVVIPADVDAAIAFLADNAWPHHGWTAAADGSLPVTLASDSVESYWILDGDDDDGDDDDEDEDVVVGLVRLLDLDDIPAGSPLFDLRVGEQHRGRGIGTLAVRWLNDHLFGADDRLHRIEATTHADNAGMRRVLEACGYRLEGEFREAWVNADGSRSNTMAYALLRSEWFADEPCA